MKKKILINAVTAKRDAGGAFQIALNFINYSIQFNSSIEWYYIVSRELDEFILKYDYIKKSVNYFVLPVQPKFLNNYLNTRKKIKEIETEIAPDLVYSILAPSYFKFRSPEVMRITNPWVTHPNKYALASLSLLKRMRMFLYILNQKRLIKKRNYFITQSQTAKKGLIRITKKPSENVRIVPNVLPPIFANRVISGKKKRNKASFLIACIGAPHPNKNIEIIPDVIKILQKKYQITNIKFITTIPKENNFFSRFNILLKRENLESFVINKGYCTQEQLVNIYSECELCFFPSLLETFSATLLEAMKFSLPVIASDFDFNKEVVGNAGLYFKPKCAADAAEKIMQIYNDKQLRIALQKNINKKVSEFPDYNSYFKNTNDYLLEVVNKYINTHGNY